MNNMSKYKWEDNSIQFPRLLSEIVATQEIDLKPLMESMDLTSSEIWELFARAEQEYRSIKESLFDNKGEK